MAATWKKTRGKLGPMAPLLGSWIASADSPMGHVTCLRTYNKFGEGYVRLEAEWKFASREPGQSYREICLFGPDSDDVLTYWSYTSDGKKSSGKLAEALDVHRQSVCFEARMEAGFARQVFWPADSGGMHWIVESRTKKGWRRIADHHYRPA